MIAWYNLLINAKITDFVEAVKEETAPEAVVAE